VLELPTHAEAKASGDVVLIVDDEESVRRTVGQMLQRLGYHTLLAADGLEGIALFQAHAEQVSCILLDVTMPQMSGLEALQAIRTIEADVPIILMSGYSKEAIIQHDEGLAAVDFLAKPFSLTELEAKLCCLPKNWHGDTVTV
jgi:CheY-like chemotaxis protein